MDSLRPDDLSRVLRSMPKDAFRLMVSGGRQGRARIFLAGGAIRAIIAGEAVSDWDFLGASPLAVEDFVLRIRASRSSLPTRIYATQNASTLLTLGHTPIHGITRWSYSEPSPLLAEFDFTIAQAVAWFDGEEWQSLCADGFYTGLAAKRLVYTSPVREEDAGGSMLRVMKFVRRGYSISPEELAKVMARVFAEVRTNDSAVDPAKAIAGLLREVDPLSRIDGLDLDDGLGDPLIPAAEPQRWQ